VVQTRGNILIKKEKKCNGYRWNIYQKVGWPYTYIFERYIFKMLMAMTLPSISKQNKFGA